MKELLIIDGIEDVASLEPNEFVHCYDEDGPVKDRIELLVA